MSTVKSAQQILGQLLKQRLAAEKTKDPTATATGGNKLFLVSIQRASIRNLKPLD